MAVPSAYDIERYRQRYGARATPAQIAKMLKCCERDVHAIMFPAPVDQPEPSPSAPSFPWDDRNLRLSALMFEMECSVEDVAKAIGCTVEDATRRRRQVVAANHKAVAA